MPCHCHATDVIPPRYDAAMGPVRPLLLPQPFRLIVTFVMSCWPPVPSGTIDIKEFTESDAWTDSGFPNLVGR